ncbi:E3 UBIQUITIN-PROTEIN LIGASE RHF2A [Salix koriyanagi]|uniref:RING-type E3 ubiquitin transferase n=1 Tax=Salix koriyanagi TaxID=2511006 RepID=A0A9Q0V0U8_9ROSI|nr:E3 UBIQUITIN-PROTEIN LIGASE RHF2A [Salix koriyanagi]
MEEMEERKKSSEAHLTVSAAAFVEGGIQEACDDACSICLENFCDSNPSTVTSCKHEFHLQCILEWCQRSSQCPMCWQPISLKDPTSQGLLEAVEQERSFRFNQSRNATIFHHPALGDFELQHLPVGENDAELEERIIQHLAAAAAMGRRRIARREGQRNRSSAQGRPQFLVFSSQPNESPDGSISSSPTQREGEPVSAITIATSSFQPHESSLQPITPLSSHALADPCSASASGSSFTNQHVNSTDNRYPNQSSPSSQDKAGPSDLQSFSESIKSKFNAVSMRYKESISNSTRGWKERFFTRNTTIADQGSDVTGEVNAGIATVSRMMEHLETRDDSKTGTSSVSNSVDGSVAESNSQQVPEVGGVSATSDPNTKVQASHAASSGSV